MTVGGTSNAAEVLRTIEEAYPEARVELRFRTPLELLVATILSAQCTDRRVNEVTETLFVDYPDARAYADADLSELEEAVRPTGFFRQKAKNIKACCADLVERFGGRVFQVPQADGPIVTPGGQAPAIRSKGHRVDPALMTAEDHRLRPRPGQVPQVDSGIITPGGQSLAIRTKGHRPDTALVTAENSVEIWLA